jgi:hypothetical protein
MIIKKTYFKLFQGMFSSRSGYFEIHHRFFIFEIQYKRI